MSLDYRGVFAVLCTPFTDQGELDEAGLRRVVEFSLAGGATGLVAPVNASEFYTLTDDERKRVVELVVEQTAGRVPVVAGCTSVSAQHARMLALHAQSVGAAAVMSMPPAIRKAVGQEIYDYYQCVGQAIEIPLVIQDFSPPIGTPMPVDLMVRMVREIPHANYLKEETALGPHVITQLRERCGEALHGIMGGQGGRFLFNEVARGACGTMPACHLIDLHVQLWELLETGRVAEARRLFAQMLPMLNFEGMYQVNAYKEVLRRRGVIETAVCRGGPAELDAVDQAELTEILTELEPRFRLRNWGTTG